MINLECWQRSVLWQTVDGRVPVQDVFSDRPHAFQRLVQAAKRNTAANQAKSEKIVLYSSLPSEIDYESLTAEHTLADYRCQISSTLLESLC